MESFSPNDSLAWYKIIEKGRCYLDFNLKNQVYRELREVEAPTTIPELEKLLNRSLETIQKFSCGCPVCTAALIGVAATKAVMNDAVLMSPSESERGIAGLIYRLHVVHMNHTLNALAFYREGVVVTEPPPEVRDAIVEVLKHIVESHKK